MLGSLERFLSVYIEHTAGWFPVWLAPEQVAVLPVGAEQRAAADALRDRLVAAGVRVRVDDDGDTLARRIAVAHHDGVPVVAIIGAREQAAGTVTLRGRDGQVTRAVDAAVADLVARCARVA